MVFRGPRCAGRIMIRVQVEVEQETRPSLGGAMSHQQAENTAGSIGKAHDLQSHQASFGQVFRRFPSVRPMLGTRIAKVPCCSFAVNSIILTCPRSRSANLSLLPLFA
jgi:hypothetical protein